ncbi:MAG: hypothetical protein IKI32_03840 [Lachnospiraceae bacterium]|nr:hypothetical protein [Lachnospiraceae bacterium]MBR7076036.1 hypothetical protein [Lachnospiraceae bacterium]MDO4206638.1 hypothetical protein [Lachnospiraceae bacterium]
MKKRNRKLIAGTAMVATAAALTACGLNPTVYGPPPAPETESSIDDINIGPEEDVYGPPEFFGETEADDLEPEQGVYGPPPAINEPVYGPPDEDQSPVQP